MVLQDRLSGAGLKPPPSCCGQMPSVVSVGGKARGKLVQVRIRETNESEPNEDASLRSQVASKPDAGNHLGGIRQVPDDWAGGDRRREGVKRMQAIVRNCRNQCCDAKGEVQAAKTARREYRSGALGRTDSYERGRPCNGARAKGSGQAVASPKQLETG